MKISFFKREKSVANYALCNIVILLFLVMLPLCVGYFMSARNVVLKLPLGVSKNETISRFSIVFRKNIRTEKRKDRQILRLSNDCWFTKYGLYPYETVTLIFNSQECLFDARFVSESGLSIDSLRLLPSYAPQFCQPSP